MKNIPSSERLERAERRASKKVDREVEVSISHESPEEPEEVLGVEIQMDITARRMEEILEISALRAYEDSSKKEIQVLKDEVARLTARLSEEILEIEGFKGDDQKILFYTGLNNWSTFSILLDYLQPHLMQRAALSPFQQVLMTLMRLRLNLSGQNLAYRFIVHPSTVSRMFAQVLQIMYIKLKPLIIWPEREILLKTMPMDFRKYCPKCIVIIDCFEIFLERPTSVLARAQTFSSYKHHNTVKYLIGITPQGTVSFISEGGRQGERQASD